MSSKQATDAVLGMYDRLNRAETGGFLVRRKNRAAGRRKNKAAAPEAAGGTDDGEGAAAPPAAGGMLEPEAGPDPQTDPKAAEGE